MVSKTRMRILCINLNEYHDVGDVYPTIKKKCREWIIFKGERLFSGKLAVVDYLDTSEESSHYIATVPEDLLANTTVILKSSVSSFENT